MVIVVNTNPAVDRISVVRFKRGHTLRPVRFKIWPGGSGVHAGHVAAELGSEVLVMGFAGGHSGAMLSDLLKSHGLQHELFLASGETRGTYSLIDIEHGNVCDIAEYGPMVSDRQVNELVAAYQRALKRATFVIVSGSNPAGCPAELDVAAVTFAKRVGVPVLADVAGDLLGSVVKAGVWCVKPSLEELELAEGRKLNGEELFTLSQTWRSYGVEHVCISLGRAGVFWESEAGTYRIGVRGTRSCYNTIGSGDAFAGGFAASYEREGVIEKAIRVGVSAATANLAYDEPGHCTREDVGRILPMTFVEPVSAQALDNRLQANRA